MRIGDNQAVILRNGIARHFDVGNRLHAKWRAKQSLVIAEVARKSLHLAVMPDERYTRACPCQNEFVFPQHGATADSLISDADRSMYVAKRNNSKYSFAQ